MRKFPQWKLWLVCIAQLNTLSLSHADIRLGAWACMVGRSGLVVELALELEPLL